MEDLGIKINTSLGNSIKNMETASNGFKKLTNSTNNTHSSFAKFNTIVTKSNNKFTNLNKDLNRSSASFGTLTNRLTKLTNVFNIGTLASYGFGSSLANMVQSALDMIETTNLFNVALGDTSTATREVVSEMSTLFGLDQTNLENSVGTYALLARSMGMTTDQASTLSFNMAKLATDYASLTNVPVAQAMADLKSGLVGQSETVYKYGLDVTEAGIKSEALAEGITKSVRNMTQGEKMALRYNAMLRQSSLTQGDFARTINTPANQLKILSERFTTLSRAIGTIFIPMLQFALPYLNAMVLVLTNIARSIASVFGYTADATGGNTSSGLDSITDSSEDATDAVDSTTSSVEKLKRATMGFDQLNIINEPTSSKSSESADNTSILPTMNLTGYDNMMKNVKQISTDLAKTMEETLVKIRQFAKPAEDALNNLYENGIKKLIGFEITSLLQFYDLVLVPFGKWTLGKGLPQLFNLLNDFIMSIKWDMLTSSLQDFFEALEPFVEGIGQGLIDFFTVMAKISSVAINAFVIVFKGFTTVMSALPASEWRIYGTAIGELIGAILLFKTLVTISETIKKIGLAFDALFLTLSANPILAIVSAVVLLGTAIYTIANTKTAKDIDSTSQSIKDLTKSVDMSIEKFNEAPKTISASYGATREFADKYFELADNFATLSDSQKTMLQTYAKYIVDDVPELASSINTVTGEFTGQKNEVYNTIDALEKYAKKLAMQEVLKDLYVEQMKLNIAIKENGTKYNDARNTMVTFLAELDDITVAEENALWQGYNLNDMYEIYADRVGRAGKSSQYTSKEIDELNDNQNNLEGSLKNTNSAISTATGLIVEYGNTVTNSATNTTNGVASAFNNLSPVLSSYGYNASTSFIGAFNSPDIVGNAYNIVNSVQNAFAGLNVGQFAYASAEAWVNTFSDKISQTSFSMEVDPTSGLGDNLASPLFGIKRHFAKGGIVSSATIFGNSLVGEDGTEAIVPLENNTEWIQRVATEINDTNTNITYSDIKKAFKDALRESDLGDTVLYVGSEPLARAANKGNKLIDRRYNLVLE